MTASVSSTTPSQEFQPTERLLMADLIAPTITYNKSLKEIIYTYNTGLDTLGSYA